MGDYSDVAPSVLAPFEGYFVENVGAEPETLWVPPKQASPVAVAALAAAGTGNPASLSVAAARQGSLENWRLRLAARTEHAVDEWNEFGVSPGAADAFDTFDLRKPPCPPGPWVRLAITHRDWETRPGAYRRDLRQPGSTGYTCEFEVLSATAGEAVMIELSEVIPVASGQLVRLIDREQGSVVDVLRSPVTGTQGASRRTESLEIGNALAHYRLVSYGPQRSYRLAVIVGDPAYVTHALDDTRAVPARLTLDQNAPNPFGLATRIRFGLPAAAIVHAEIFNLLGERVVSLMDRERLAPGQHTLVWEGSTAKGVRAPNGVYMLRVATDKETTTRRLVVIR